MFCWVVIIWNTFLCYLFSICPTSSFLHPALCSGKNLHGLCQLSPCLGFQLALANVRDISRRPGRATSLLLDFGCSEQVTFLFSGSFFQSATEIFMGSGNPSLASSDLEMIMTFRCCHLKIQHCPLLLSPNPAYTFENASFITFS